MPKGVYVCICVDSRIIGGEVRGLTIPSTVYLDIELTKNHYRKSVEKTGSKSSTKIFKE